MTRETDNHKVTLYTWAFDCSGQDVEDYISKTWSSLPEKDVWALVEQMHRFQFQGPDRDEVAGLDSLKELEKFGLRGRIFWSWGQIEWRRLNLNLFRVVVTSEEQVFPNQQSPVKGNHLKEEATWRDSTLILWGSSDQNGLFREKRIQGRDEIEYPAALKSAAKSFGLGSRPGMIIRAYHHPSGEDLAWRFLEPTLI
ncbi:MAG: hypothetical protein HQK55_05580 [Deltaproteobacteria bacterium]|nr:hypothetical protein [Deltaproteobacteria bacterium]